MYIRAAVRDIPRNYSASVFLMVSTQAHLIATLREMYFQYDYNKTTMQSLLRFLGTRFTPSNQ
jgi:hypothetical protein